MMPDEMPTNLWLQVSIRHANYNPQTLIEKRLTNSKVDDLNQPFTFQTNEFDFIQSRGVVTGIKRNRWPSYITDCVRYVVTFIALFIYRLYHAKRSSRVSSITLLLLQSVHRPFGVCCKLSHG